MIVLVAVPLEAELVVADGQVPLDLVHVVVDDLAVIVVVGFLFMIVACIISLKNSFSCFKKVNCHIQIM